MTEYHDDLEAEFRAVMAGHETAQRLSDDLAEAIPKLIATANDAVLVLRTQGADDPTIPFRLLAAVLREFADRLDGGATQARRDRLTLP